MNNISHKGGKYTKKTGLLNKEEDELEEGPWHRVQPQPSDKTSPERGREGRQLGSAFGSLS